MCPKNPKVIAKRLKKLNEAIAASAEAVSDFGEENDLWEDMDVDPDFAQLGDGMDAAENGSNLAVPPDDNSRVGSPQIELPIQEQSPQPPKRIRYGNPRYRDMLPTLPCLNLPEPRPLPNPHPESPPPLEPHPQHTPSPTPPSETFFCTEPDTFGLFRKYRVLPSRDPDNQLSSDQLNDASTFISHDASDKLDPTRVFGPRAEAQAKESEGGDGMTTGKKPYAPFLNVSVFRLMNWFYKSATKSLEDLNDLVVSVILPHDFEQQHFAGFDAKREANRLNDESLDANNDDPLPFNVSDKWTTSEVKVPVPLAGESWASEDGAPTISLNMAHRDLVEVITSAYQDPVAASQIHWKGYMQMWQPSEDSPPMRVYGEAYTSDSYLEMEAEIKSPAGCMLETTVVPMGGYSDETKLTSFGDVAMWPMYLYLLSIAKAITSKPSSFSAHHVAYFPPIPDWVADAYYNIFHVVIMTAVLTFIRREFVQAMWIILLTPQFIDAYINGIVVLCGDGVLRRLFPRFFVYSCDYKEKVGLAGIKFLSDYPCPICLTKKSDFDQLGTEQDRKRRANLRTDTKAQQKTIQSARRNIFQRGVSVASETIVKTLKWSVTPVVNAFSWALSCFGFQFYRMFNVDVMHDIELGTWKGLFTQLLRLIEGQGGRYTDALNRRYREVQSFGASIRRFGTDVAAMKRKSARDFENLLQCAAPCFEGLFEDEDTDERIQDLLFTKAAFHGFAKFRMHHELSVRIFDGLLTHLGNDARSFADICDELNVVETSREVAGRERRNKARQKRGKKVPVSQGNQHRQRAFNMRTYKWHTMTHYPPGIPRYGTLDVSSTQKGETEHKRIKVFYRRTNKKAWEQQIAKHERRAQRLRLIAQRMDDKRTSGLLVPANQKEDLPLCDADSHHQISRSTRFPVDITRWCAEHPNDPSLHDLTFKIKRHLLARLRNCSEDELSDYDCTHLRIQHDRIFRHKTMRINYTTYDVHRDQDCINPRTHSDVMFLSSDDDDEHPYVYGRICGIFHALVRDDATSTIWQSEEFLLARWFENIEPELCGWQKKRLFRVAFLSTNDPGAFGIVNPAYIIRASHMIPRFCLDSGDDDEEYAEYRVNMFADRDMIVRYCGFGIGHLSTLPFTRKLLEDLCTAAGVDLSEFEGGKTEGASGDGSDEEVEEIEEEGEEEPVGSDITDDSLSESDFSDADGDGDDDDYVPDEHGELGFARF